MQQACKFCDNHQQINMEEAPPGAGRKWNVTNLDGSFHKHIKYGAQPQQPPLTQQQPQTVTINQPTNPTPEYEAKITAGLRSEAIAKAHEENMEASNKLRQVIQSLVDQLVSIETTMTMFNETIRAYLDAPVSSSKAPRDEEYSEHL